MIVSQKNPYCFAIGKKYFLRKPKSEEKRAEFRGNPPALPVVKSFSFKLSVLYEKAPLC